MEYIILAAAVLALICSLAALIRINQAYKSMSDKLTERELRRELENQNNSFGQQISILRNDIEQSMSRYNNSVRENISFLTDSNEKRLENMRQTIDVKLETISAKNDQNLENVRATVESKLESILDKNDKNLEHVRTTVEDRLNKLQQDNSLKLEKMRETVDEKLTGTLEKRLGESFGTVSRQLTDVYKGLGEMQKLAEDVGGLKKVLSNVKTRGTWGEVALGSLLEQLLNPQQYKQNVKVAPRRNNIVEYAICLPGADGTGQVYLPVDSKFPMEDYISLVDASEGADAAALEAAQRGLKASVRRFALDIRDKYIAPPYTTDFGIMYLPTEGLYAEVTKDAALCEQLQRECRVTIMGPATLGAFLNSLQMGFKTLAIQKRSGEVWKILSNVKKDFGKFGDLLDKTSEKLEQASKTIGEAKNRSEQIQKKLRSVEELPEEGAPEAVIGENIPEQASEA